MLFVIIPAFNEERLLPQTLGHVRKAIEFLGDATDREVEIIVADNASTDRTAEIGAEFGAKVVSVLEHNIAKVRNAGAGAAAASSDLFVFLDADTTVPENLFSRIFEVMHDPACCGGAVDIDHRPSRLLIKLYLGMWHLIGKCLGMAQGATQFCRADAFHAIRGYDESMYMGEDVDFYWRLSKFAKATSRRVRFLNDLRVVPSSRRFDQWPTLRILIQTNPLYILLFRYRRTAWRGWYNDVPR